MAGSLGLNLEEDPLKTWVNRTASEAQVCNRFLSFTVTILESASQQLQLNHACMQLNHA